MNKRTIIERMKQATNNMALEQFIDELESLRQSLKNKSRFAWYCESQYGLTCGMAAINAFFQSPLLNIANLKSFLLKNYQAFMPELDHYTLRTFIEDNIEAKGINADEVVSIVNKFIDGPSHTPLIQHKIGWSNALMDLLHIPHNDQRSAVQLCSTPLKHYSVLFLNPTVSVRNIGRLLLCFAINLAPWAIL